MNGGFSAEQLGRRLARAKALQRGQGEYVPEPTRDSSTIALLRDGAEGPEVFLMRRRSSMKFAAHMHVYPGGAVEPDDARVPVRLGTDPEALAARLTTSDPVVLVAAAARETFEESGVLLAVDAEGVPVAGGETLDALRRQLRDEEIPFSELLVSHGLWVDGASIVAFDHWVTPEVADFRYDTRFFAARLPEGQEAAEHGGEADSVGWWRPDDALADLEAGNVGMLAPTKGAMRRLAGFSSVDELLAAAAGYDIVPVLMHPTVVEEKMVWSRIHGVTREKITVKHAPLWRPPTRGEA